MMDNTKGKDGGLSKGDEAVTMSASQWAGVIHPSNERRNKVQEVGDEVPQAIQGTLAAVAASIMYSASGMSSWGFTEATLGLYKLYCRHEREGAMDTINGSLVYSVTEMRDMAHWLKWANAAYLEKEGACAKELEIEENCIIKLVNSSEVGKPAYVIALDHAKKAVVLGIRGTFSATDVLTDLKPHSEAFEDGYAHSGMLNSAKWLRDRVVDVLKEPITSNGYRLVLTGHSLGAGAASLLCMLLRETNEKGLTILGLKPELVTCWGFCCPPCVDKKLAQEVTFVRNVIHQDDIVARISPAALEDLRTEIVGTDWTHALEDGTKQKKLVDVFQRSMAFLDKTEKSLEYEKGDIVKHVKQQGWTAVKGWTDSWATSWSKATEGSYGAGANYAASILASGARAAGTGVAAAAKKAIMEEMKLIDGDNKGAAAVTASAVAVTAKDGDVKEGSSKEGSNKEGSSKEESNKEGSNKEGSGKERRSKEDPDYLEKMRLYVPGILYHVIRRSLQSDEKLPNELPLGVGTSTGVEKAESKYKHIVVRGDDPSSRFQRIVLSSSLISDHLCAGLKDAIADAMKWQHSGNRI